MTAAQLIAQSKQGIPALSTAVQEFYGLWTKHTLNHHLRNLDFIVEEENPDHVGNLPVDVLAVVRDSTPTQFDLEYRSVREHYVQVKQNDKLWKNKQDVGITCLVAGAISASVPILYAGLSIQLASAVCGIKNTRDIIKGKGPFGEFVMLYVSAQLCEQSLYAQNL